MANVLMGNDFWEFVNGDEKEHALLEAPISQQVQAFKTWYPFPLYSATLSHPFSLPFCPSSIFYPLYSAHIYATLTTLFSASYPQPFNPTTFPILYLLPHPILPLYLPPSPISILHPLSPFLYLTSLSLTLYLSSISYAPLFSPYLP